MVVYSNTKEMDCMAGLHSKVRWICTGRSEGNFDNKVTCTCGTLQAAEAGLQSLLQLSSEKKRSGLEVM